MINRKGKWVMKRLKSKAEAVVRKGRTRMKFIASKMIVYFSVFSLIKIKKHGFIS